ncbi:hypothetical protein KFK09_003680 [Dendrobium nobile]|uniref:Uncharacterized protein n=1 Tax=Dendrobium nobile TaxID=94219 RepID=A0A8T3C0W8_DENNO|nr:hypothetical protein KFK09_025620 [Dendrobium nobile]KAI0497534.1 hypothetical protein KFK09_020765 [Dendrobium nobile]KAI0499306.1 hypothetical protein KFK09_020209 [Dendrobium nobile]KAI0524314.1 hypothetical protein KFK09_003680 [Dendrobium nobile]
MKKETLCKGLLFPLDSYLFKNALFLDLHKIYYQIHFNRKKEKSRLSCRGYPKQL